MTELRLLAFNKHAHENNRGLRRFDAKLVYLFGEPENIIELGKFLVECGSQMKLPKPFHRHFSDYLASWHNGMVDVVPEPAVKLRNLLPKKKIKAKRRLKGKKGLS
jgi:hypothetical protein